MLSSRLFWKIFLIYAVLVLVSAGFYVTLVAGRLRAVVEEQAETRLVDAAVVLRQALVAEFPKVPSPAMQDQLRGLSSQTETRFTLVADDGTIVGDSDAEPSRMDNHLDREEIQAARTSPNGIGISRRQSDTIGIAMLYAAVRAGSREGLAGFVRTSVPLAKVDAQVAEIERRIRLVAAGIVAAAFLLTYAVSSRLVASVDKLSRAADAMRQGALDTRIPVHANDELGALAAAFNLMGRELSNRREELLRRCRALEEDSDRLATVLGSMIEGVVAVDESQRIHFANKAAQTLLEFSGPSDVGRPLWEVVRHPTLQQVVNDALAGRDRTTVELDLPRKHATVAMLATRLPGNPCPGVVLVLHDVTELRRLENLRREFVSNVSHELKTPLTAIQACTETLLAGAIDEPEHCRQFVARIEEHAERLHALILDLLRLARIESTTDVFDLQPVALAEVVDHCVDEHRPLAEAKKISLAIEPPPEPLRVRADEEGLHTILSNLVDNAVKYTPTGGRVSLRWRAEGKNAVIAVEDTGPGIAEEHQGRIFERFYRVDKARSRELGGTGLGLSIVKHLVHVFGGTVEVRSQPGHGSTFTVRLPLD